jgi:hypothetical protein
LFPFSTAQTEKKFWKKKRMKKKINEFVIKQEENMAEPELTEDEINDWELAYTPRAHSLSQNNTHC